jgi:polyhydroxyalkanoate synthase subunit PhaC
MGPNDAPSPGDDRTPAGSAGAPGAPARDVDPDLPLGGGLPPGAPPDASGMLQAAMDLLSPAEAAKQLPWLFSELTKIAMGQSELEYGPKDARFKDPTWTANPAFRGLGLTYRLFEEWAGRMAGAAGASWEGKARASYLANIMTASLAPTNFPWTNPAVLKRAFETGGRSLFNGTQNMLRDLANGGMPRMVNRDALKVGEQLACTPGAVVYREDMFELLEYTPKTPTVRSRPLLMVPPEINRYYVLDLAPGRSMVEYAVENGLTTFMVSWRNPREELGHGCWGFDDYVAATLRAIEIVKDITHNETINVLGACAGGMTNTLALGVLAAKGDSSVNAATFMVTMMTNASPNVVGMLSSGPSQKLLDQAAAANKVVPGSTLKTTFALLRPNDLVFNYVVSGWLLGEHPPAFDVLAWNDDATAVSARFSADTGRIVMNGSAAVPGGITSGGTPIDLAKVTCDSFHVAGFTDHIVPWRTCYDLTQLLGGEKEVALVKSGHIQSFVNPARTAKYGYWTAPAGGPDPDAWLAAAEWHGGSWWPQWLEWLLPRSGAEKKARAGLGNRKYPPLGPAPGTYPLE